MADNLDMHVDAASFEKDTMTLTQPPSKLSAKRSNGGGNKKGTPADRRATHNAVERARRESLNVRFLELAANLPATCTVRRPSKNLIVNKSIDFVRTALHNDAVLRLKLDEIMRQNQSLLQEVNQFRAERGLSPRVNPTLQQGQSAAAMQTDFSNATASNLSAFSKDALASAFRMPGLPQPLASADFTKQVMEQNVPIDLSQMQQLFGAEVDEETLSNHASTDGYSGAASERGSPGATAEATNVASVTASTTLPSLSTYQIQQSRQPQYNALLHQSGHGAYHTANNAGSHADNVSSSYAHLAGINTQNVNPPFDYLTAMSPTTAAMFTNMVSSFGSNSRQDHLPDIHSHAHESGPPMNRNRSTPTTTYGHGNYFAMPA